MTRTSDNWLKPFAREFVAEGQAIITWEDLEPYYQSLDAEPLDSPEALEKWLLKWSELRAVADERVTRSYIEMTCRTDDAEKKEAYLYCVREIEPKMTEWENRLERRYYDSPHRAALDQARYGQLDRMTRVAIELYDKRNIPLKVKLQEMSQSYQELIGGMMVTFEGKERTMPQMAQFLREPDRQLRQRAFTASAERRLAETDKLEEMFDAMTGVRAEYAANLGLENYRDYCFREKLRDYTPDDCFRFHEAIEATAVPLARKITEQRRKDMGLEAVCPWDTECDERGRPPLKPFTKTEELTGGVGAIFESVDARLGGMFREILSYMDLESRKGKAPGGYQATLSESRVPFIFTNAVGSQSDVNTLLHEGGHAFHTIQCRDEPLIWYRHAAMEFSEVASMTQELVGGQRLDAFYKDPEERKRARQEHLKHVIGIFGWVARVDAFQHWIYTSPGHTRDARAAAWLESSERFSSGVDWAAAPEGALRYLWHRQLHIFELPFYYIEYAIAQLGALQIYREYKRDRQKAVDGYLRALSLGGTLPAPELFEAAGIRFDFSPGLLGELMEMIEEELDL